MHRICALVLLSSLFTPAALYAQAPSSEGAAPDRALRVAISPFPPLVLTDEERPRGYSIDLWERVADELDLDFEYVATSGVREKLSRLEGGEVDVAIGGITLTSAREAIVDFTHPTLESGLGILVRIDEEPSLFARLGGAFSRTRLGIVFGFLFLIIAAGHLIWLAERGKPAFSDHYVPGVFEGMYWAVVTASTVGYGDKAPVKWAGRVLACVLIVVSLPLFALFTAELASALTLEEIHAQIRGPSDLEGRRVGVVRGTQSAAWASERGLDLAQWDRIDEVYAALLAGEVAAVVYDAPALSYLAQGEGKGRVRMVGEPFLEQDLGMAVPEGSPLRERLNRALLELVESGELSRIRVKWFG